MARTTRRGATQGFSLYDMQDTISQAVDLLGDALTKQGVTVNPDQLLISLQTVVKSIGQGYSDSPYGGSYSPMTASDLADVPYSVSGDLLAIAYEQFGNGDKRSAVRSVITAMNNNDFGDIVSGLLAINSRHNKLLANEDPDEEDETEEDDTSDSDDSEDSNEDEEDSDLSDEDIDDLIEEDDDDEEDKTLESDDESKPKVVDKKEAKSASDKPKSEDSKESDEEEDPEPVKKPKDKSNPPMNKTSSSVLESQDLRKLRNKMSLAGDPKSLSRARAFMKTNSKS